AGTPRCRGSAAGGSAIDRAGASVGAATPPVKLSGMNGALLWKRDLHGDLVTAIAFDSADDVLMSTFFRRGSRKHPRYFHRVFKLDGGTGAVRWKTSSSRLDGVFSLAASGDLLAQRVRSIPGHPGYGEKRSFVSALLKKKAERGRLRSVWAHAFPVDFGIACGVIDA